jgi:hypothetical protein
VSGGVGGSPVGYGFLRWLVLRWKLAAGCFLLGIQVVGIGAMQFSDLRYFCWAPYDEITEFKISVVINGRELSREAVMQRYRLPDGSRDNRSWAHVPAAIAHYERTRGRSESAKVEYRYRVNGGEPRVWRWPDATEVAR